MVKLPNYLDSLTVDECLEILQKNGLDLDISVKDNPTTPAFEINKIDHDLWEKVKELLGGSGEYNPKKMRGVVFNFGRYFSPISNLKTMLQNRDMYLKKILSSEKSPN